MVFLVSGGLSEGARPFPLKILDTKISVNSTSGECIMCVSTGCPTKNYTLFWRAVAPLNFELGIKVGGVLESSGSQL